MNATGYAQGYPTGLGIAGNAIPIFLARGRAAAWIGYSVQIVDVTAKARAGETYPSPPITLDSIKILDARITYGDMHIFGHWHLTNKPALLIGMDVLGLLDTFIIDYHRHELQLRMRTDQK